MPRDARLPRHRADRLASDLHLDVGSARNCLACLSIVAFSLDSGERRALQGRLVSITKDLWAEGLSEHAIAAVEEACHRGVRDAAAALADLEELGGRSPISRAMTLRLAGQLPEQARHQHRVFEMTRSRPSTPFPVLN